MVLITVPALGGYSPSEGTDDGNLSMESFGAMGSESGIEGASIADLTQDASFASLAPEMAATGPEDDLAVYTEQVPSQTSLGKLLPLDAQASALGHVYYQGDYLAWSSFDSVFPSTSPGLWVAGSDGWSWYVTMPFGSWAQQLLYVPVPSSLSMYEVYPDSSVRRYNLGVVTPGYYYLWYYADTPGRHFCQFGLDNSYSNPVVIDVYSRPTPPQPSPKELCERNPLCSWVNGQCYCREPTPVPKPVPNPVAQCEENPDCHWVNGECLCTGWDPDPSPMPGPVPNPVAQCEKNPDCHWVNGQCLCTGAELGGEFGDLGGDFEDLSGDF